MGIFGNVGKASVNQGGVFFLPGQYKVEIEACKVVESSRGADTFFVIECKILESNCSERPQGSKASQVINIGKVMGPVNIKAFVCAISGVDADREDTNEQVVALWEEMTGQAMDFESICELIVSDDQPVAGEQMDLECVEILTRESRKPFTKHIWQTVDRAA